MSKEQGDLLGAPKTGATAQAPAALRQHLEARAKGETSVTQDPIATFLHKRRDELARALPRNGMDVDRLARIALTTIRLNKDLGNCNLVSLFAAIIQSAQLDLEPGGPLGEAWLVPYGGEVQFQIGYKGYIKLFWRSGLLRMIEAHTVREKDFFEFEYGTARKLRHIPAKGDRGLAAAYYMYAEYANGGNFFLVLYPEDIERIRKFSKAPNSNGWVKHYDAMALKTVLRQAERWMPKSVEMQRAFAQDETVKLDLDEDMSLVPDAEFKVMDDDPGPADPTTTEPTGK